MPYPQKEVATGVLFGNKEGTTELSPSLSVIRNACIKEEDFAKFDVTLESWAKQGILLLNSALTCEMNNPRSHTMLWRPFISKFLAKLSNSEPGLVYVLFGDQAKTFKPYINTNVNSIIEVRHPAYYARLGLNMPEWIFPFINKLMVDKYGEPIKWC